VARAWEEEQRDPATLRFSVMTGVLVGTDPDDLERRTRALMDRLGEGGSAGVFLLARSRDWVTGTVDEVVERLRAYEEAGVDRIMLQHLAHDDVETVALLGREVIPALT
jgi:alkanesulfonate monooxygenase SsuD/methylene tetrahydromethanopterin reductase-like flavin-dependent oxidoreductase (luciferase family)